MPSLLGLPFELREQILDYVIHAEKAPPLEFSEDESQRRIPMPASDKRLIGSPEVDVYCQADKDAYHSNTAALLAVCQQLRLETKSRIGHGPLVYKLDLAVIQGKMLWPTWTSVPCHRTTIDIVQVTFRATGPGLPCVHSLRSRTNGASVWCWWFYCVLLDFFTHGVASPPTKEEVAYLGPRQSSDQKMAIKVLNLNFVDPFLPHKEEPDFRGEEDYNCPHCVGDCHHENRAVHSSFRSNRFYVKFVRAFFRLLRIKLLSWGEVVYRGIEVVHFRFKGELKCKLVVAQWLRAWPTAYLGRDTEQWLSETFAIRESFGLENLGRAAPHNRFSYGPDVRIAEGMAWADVPRT